MGEGVRYGGMLTAPDEERMALRATTILTNSPLVNTVVLFTLGESRVIDPAHERVCLLLQIRQPRLQRRCPRLQPLGCQRLAVKPYHRPHRSTGQDDDYGEQLAPWHSRHLYGSTGQDDEGGTGPRTASTCGHGTGSTSRVATIEGTDCIVAMPDPVLVEPSVGGLTRIHTWATVS